MTSFIQPSMFMLVYRDVTSALQKFVPRNSSGDSWFRRSLLTLFSIQCSILRKLLWQGNWSIYDITFCIYYPNVLICPPIFAEKNYWNSTSFIMRLIKNGPIIQLITWTLWLAICDIQCVTNNPVIYNHERMNQQIIDLRKVSSTNVSISDLVANKAWNVSQYKIHAVK